MLTIHDSHHIPTSRHLKGHQACRVQTGFCRGRAEARRVYQAHLDLLNRRLRFAWLVEQWRGHQARCAFAKEQNA